MGMNQKAWKDATEPEIFLEYVQSQCDEAFLPKVRNSNSTASLHWIDYLWLFCFCSLLGLRIRLLPTVCSVSTSSPCQIVVIIVDRVEYCAVTHAPLSVCAYVQQVVVLHLRRLHWPVVRTWPTVRTVVAMSSTNLNVSAIRVSIACRSRLSSGPKRWRVFVRNNYDLRPRCRKSAPRL